MFEKVNPSHPDKIADRIAGALVDYAYTLQKDPKVAIEVLIGHGICHIINETSINFNPIKVTEIVSRIAGTNILVDYKEVPQDEHLAENQSKEIRCGDNGIFRGVPFTDEQSQLNYFTKILYNKFQSDGKFILDNKNKRLVICQSNATEKELRKYVHSHYPLTDYEIVINPLGEWSGGTDVDCGATNRKLGSDMADSCTGGGLHGKDLSKSDVSINIYAWLKAQETKQIVEIYCSIGDVLVDGRPYSEIVEIARNYIQKLGGFEKLAEWGYQKI